MKIKPSLVAGWLLAGFMATATAQMQAAPAAPVPGEFQVKYYGQFSELPVGSVQPRGWLQQWLERQAQGLTGHPGKTWLIPMTPACMPVKFRRRRMKDKWWKVWWPYEQSAYFVDATTRLGWLVQDPGISQRRDANINYILDHASGTNYGGSTACWPNAVVGRALMAQFSATGDPRVAAVMQNWLLTSAEAIEQGARNGVNFEEAFYLYGLTGDSRLLGLCRKVYTGYLNDTNSFFTKAKIQGKTLFHEHGVTAAEELKCLPLMYAYTGDAEALQLARQAYQKVLDNNLMADGGIVSSEHLERTAFYSVHESCDLTDWSWSLGYLFMATGEARYADLIERTTFNALPGAVTKDFKQLQYFSGVNQMVIAATNTHMPHWPTRMTYRAAHDTECCAGNINRAMPNYVIRMWMRAADGGLAAVYYGPGEVATTVAGQKITIAEETDYPFRDRLSFHVKTAAPVKFNLQFRMPQWCDAATIRVNGKKFDGIQKPGTFASVLRTFRDGDIVDLQLPMAVRMEDWFHGQGESLVRGPLVYSLQIAEQRVEHQSDPDDIRPFLSGHAIKGFPEVEFLPAGDWRYGFAPGLKSNLKNIHVVESAMTENPFIAGQAPVRLEVPLNHLPAWAPEYLDKTTPAQSEPAGLPTSKQQLTMETPTMGTFVPYGATHLRLTTLPVVQTSK